MFEPHSCRGHSRYWCTLSHCLILVSFTMYDLLYCQLLLPGCQDTTLHNSHSAFLSPHALNCIVHKMSCDQLLRNLARAMLPHKMYITLKTSELEITIAKIVFLWAKKGFRTHLGFSSFKMLRTIQGILTQWVFPHHQKCPRRNFGVWQLITSISCVLGLYILYTRNHCKKHYKVMLRAFPPSIQHAMLYHDLTTIFWNSYLAVTWYSIWDPACCTRNS